RTAVLWEGLPEAVQVVVREAPFVLERHDWSGLADQDAAFARLVQEDRRRGFDVGRPPLLRVAVAELGGGRQRVLWSVHHLLLDGWSMALILDELGDIHQAMAAERTPAPRRRRPFREYVGWVRAQDRDRAREHWRGLLADVESANEL